MPGNCVDVLKDIQGWLCDLNMPNILWLSGSPGSGKTTIASTVVADFESFSGQSTSIVIGLSLVIRTICGGILLWILH